MKNKFTSLKTKQRILRGRRKERKRKQKRREKKRLYTPSETKPERENREGKGSPEQAGRKETNHIHCIPPLPFSSREAYVHWKTGCRANTCQGNVGIPPPHHHHHHHHSPSLVTAERESLGGCMLMNWSYIHLLVCALCQWIWTRRNHWEIPLLIYPLCQGSGLDAITEKLLTSQRAEDAKVAV